MSTALYRRYRPETFTDVIGQEHVTGPLMAALDNARVNHAYLFSGPRGCGKTTSARIFARCLNCAKGPTSTPCGTCDSCVELARGGSGSIDVVEMDAASHGGVDDARELRERAAFAPARDKYKVFIIDEAHMVTTQGFNALLKLVEEPPPHVKFVFATTEPEKVIGTIRSRTHHYPFRLVPPEILAGYLESLADAEGVSIESGVLPLVVRAGGGSVRDSLSVLDQLMAGSTDGGIGYERAIALLGFTHGALLDDTVAALAARDGSSLFRVVDRVIESGHAPRRFVEDVLERLRDLIVVRAAGDQAGHVLRGVPADQLERMQTQASHLSAATLSRAADLVNEALTEMTGATSPRLQLELLCARLLLPAADDGVDGFAARLDRLEGAARSGSFAAPAATGAPNVARPASPPPAAATPVQAATGIDAPPVSAAPSPAQSASAASGWSAPPAEPRADGGQGAPAPTPDADGGTQGRTAPSAAERHAPQSQSQSQSQSRPAEMGGTARGSAEPAGRAAAAGVASAAAAAAGSVGQSGGGSGAGGLSADEVRRRWPEVLDTLTRIRRITWTLISQDAQVVDLDATTLQLGFSTSGLASTFRNGGHADYLQQALAETLGLNVRIEPVIADGSRPASGGGGPASNPRPAEPRQQAEPRQPAEPAPAEDWPTPARASVAPPTSADPTGSPESTGPTSASDAASPPSTPDWPATTQPPAAPPADANSRAASDQAGVADRPAPSSSSAAAPETRDPAESGPPPWDVPEEDRSGDATGESTDLAERAGQPADPPGPPATSGEGATQGDWPPSGANPAEPSAPGEGTAQGDPPPSGANSDESSAPPNTPPAISPREQAMAAAREARQSSLSRRTPSAASPATSPFDPGDDIPDPDDPDIESTGLAGAPLVARLLGGTVIDEVLDSGEEGR